MNKSAERHVAFAKEIGYEGRIKAPLSWIAGLPKFAIPLHAALLAVFINVLWGGNPVAVKVALEWLPPLWTGFFRFVLGVLTVALYALWRGIALWPNPAEWRSLWLLAVMFAVQITIMNVGYDMTSASVSVVIQATFPLFVALMAHFYLDDDRLQPSQKPGSHSSHFVGVSVIILREAGLAASGWVGSGALGGASVVNFARQPHRVLRQTRQIH